MATSATPVPLDLMDTDQMGAAQQSGFLNPIALSTTTTTDPDNSNFITFNVTGASNGRLNETLLAWALVLPPSAPGVRTAFGSPSVSRPGLIQDADFPHGDADNNGVYFLGTWTDTCAGEGARCLIVEFNRPGAAAIDYVNFKMSFTSPVTNASLCGAEIIYLFSDGSIHPTSFPSCPAPPAIVTTTSQMADLTVPVEIQNASTFVGATNSPCTLAPGQTTCSPPVAVSDSNIATGVESGGPICLAHGLVVSCPH
jgi:hypothetical protein